MNILHEKLVEIINFWESVTIIGFRDDGLYEIFENMLQDTKIKEFFQSHTNRDIVIRRLGVRLMQHLEGEVEGSAVYSSLGLNLSESTSVSDDIASGRSIVFIVEEIEKIRHSQKLITWFDQRNKQSRNSVMFVYLLQDVEAVINLQSSLESNSSFFENILYQPLKIETEKTFLEGMAKKRYGEIQDKKIKEEVYLQSAGHYELYKRLYKSHITGNRDTLQNYVNRLIRDLGDRSLSTIFKLLNGIRLTAADKVLIDEYRNLGLIEGGRITIPILANRIKDLAPKEKIIFDPETKSMSFGAISEFSKADLNILKFLYSSVGQLCTKEDVARVIWGQDEFSRKYSDWAIDQAVFRLRKKVEKFNIDAVIETVHGRGYILYI